MSDSPLLTITIARKPLSETSVARNVLRWGTGSLNINGARLPLQGESISTPQSDPANRKGEVGFGKGFNENVAEKMHQAQKESAERTNALGRWPANLILQHLPECRRVGTKKVRGTNPPGENLISSRAWTEDGGWGPRHAYGYHDDEGMEEIEAWECAHGCPVVDLDEQSGDRPASMTGRADPSVTHKHPAGDDVAPSGYGGGWAGGHGMVYADVGGASRYFKQIHPKES